MCENDLNETVCLRKTRCYKLTRRRLEAVEAGSRFSKFLQSHVRARKAGLAGSLSVDATERRIMICRSGERHQMAGNDDNCFFYILVHEANRDFVAVRRLGDS